MDRIVWEINERRDASSDLNRKPILTCDFHRDVSAADNNCLLGELVQFEEAVAIDAELGAGNLEASEVRFSMKSDFS